MNRLQFETSPYLLQHAHQPVDWYPWGNEAFERAMLEQKPLLISIGYATCHWCHVMAHESFDDPETAELMNTLFVNIKVDREELPDVDHMYMDALQAMTGSGGWPLNMFILPDKRPFYGGTYFPPRRAYQRASWKEVLINVSQFYQQNKEQVLQQASQLEGHIRNSSFTTPSSGSIDTNLPDHFFQQITERLFKVADKEAGGFGGAPKFPSTFALHYLLDQYEYHKNQEALEHVQFSLRNMCSGGLFDHLAGGFARYTVDRFWKIPHFEKMLYDNALLLGLLARVYRIDQDILWKNTIDLTLSWLKTEMYDPEQGFYSAQDADSEGEEGRYYVWHAAELRALLGADYDQFAMLFQIEEDGNWEHTNILWRQPETTPDKQPEAWTRWKEVRQKLIHHRRLRERPLTDTKILLGWNALMIRALCQVYLSNGQPEIKSWAIEACDLICRTFRSEEFLWYHTGKDGQLKQAAYLDDLAYWAQTLLEVSRISGDVKYLEDVDQLLNHVEFHFADPESGFFDFAHHRYEQVPVRKKDLFDSALPSANRVLAEVLAQWPTIDPTPAREQQYKAMLAGIQAQVQSYPTSFAGWASLLLRESRPKEECVIIGQDAATYYLQLHNKIQSPHVHYLVSNGEEEKIQGLKGKYRRGDTLVYVCRNFSCLEPLTDINQVLRVFS